MKIVTKVADADQANVLLELAGSILRAKHIMYTTQERYVWYDDDDSFGLSVNLPPPDSGYELISKQFFLFAIETGKLTPDISDDIEFSKDGGNTWEKPVDHNFIMNSSSDILVRAATAKFNEGDVVLSTITGRKGVIVLSEPDKHGHILIEFSGFYGLHRIDSLKHYRPSQLELLMNEIPDDVLNICDLEGQLKWLVDTGMILINE